MLTDNNHSTNNTIHAVVVIGLLAFDEAQRSFLINDILFKIVPN